MIHNLFNSNRENTFSAIFSQIQVIIKLNVIAIKKALSGVDKVNTPLLSPLLQNYHVTTVRDEIILA